MTNHDPSQEGRPLELAQELNVGHATHSDIDPRLAQLCRDAAAQGAVLLRNDDHQLPIRAHDRVALFGRCAWDWFCVGYGSGGDVVTPYTVNLADALTEAGVRLSPSLLKVYDDWRSAHPVPPKSEVWGVWPLNYPEMPVADSDVAQAASESDLAIVVLGRAAGEDRENQLIPGSYYLTPEEEALLDAVCAHFDRAAVVLDVGNIIDMAWLARYPKLAVLMAWQGGMESGHAVADVLTGAVNPCGHLTDAIACTYADYPSAANFGQEVFNNYAEDIYVGYRYFETFAPDKALFPFGYGLSYTTFGLKCVHTEHAEGQVSLTVSVGNAGEIPGRCVAQVYVAAPQGQLGKPARQLAAFARTSLLSPGASEELTLTFPLTVVASYDDSGVTGYKSAFVLEAGDYTLYVGENVRDAAAVSTVTVPETVVVRQLSEVMAVRPEHRFQRMVNQDGLAWEDVPTATTDLKQMILDRLPKDIPLTGDQGIKLADVKAGRASLEAFVAQLTPDELEAISRGEGPMDSPEGPKGNAGAFAGVTESLRDKGIPAVITTDGPAGIRLRTTCSLLPCGTLLACTWDAALVEALYHALGDEMLARGTDVLLGPGMNIHRNPLCGRNFEYFSEDPLVSGRMAAAMVRGIQHDGLSACPKHFACNNQEKWRNTTDSRVSERALREIYLRGFEWCLEESTPLNLMTSYNKINGVWSHYNYELVRTVLRGEWGYRGNVVTDWWMQYAPSPEFPALRDNGYRVRAGVDVLMPGSKDYMHPSSASDGTLTATLGEPDGMTLGEMQLVAMEVLTVAMQSSAMARLERKG